MSTSPHYFEGIRETAARRWDQLEQDPDLAGPWHQLFRQVQSPRHVLSELLQNADDAGATEATVRIEDGAFIFEHNGEDFSEAHFTSLCRFGYSNKRALHTIGFRGIGFKSTFSLGDQVELYSPTLSVCFQRQRFTEPVWSGNGFRSDGKTCIRVAICDRHRENEITKNLEEWLKSPVSLLFFKNIRRMRIGEQELHWSTLGTGPVPKSEWMALLDNPDEAFLLIRSAEEAFPEDALAEIRQERMLGLDEEVDFPPCKIEIVLGAKGRLFVVLPTGVETVLPFACNAPFIQDPARVEIKSPDTSPTNRWLLERAGRLAASAMLAWLNRAEIDVSERALAYRLFPDIDRNDSSLKGVCSTIAEDAFIEGISADRFLLTDEGALVKSQQCIAFPELVYDVWPVEQIAAFLDDKGRPALCRYIDDADRKKLLKWKFVEEINKERFLQILKLKHLPQPSRWQQLERLWAQIAPEIAGYWPKVEPSSLRIVPVQGKDTLYSAAEVVRLGEKKLLHSDDDWQFLAEYLIVLNQKWPRYLADRRREAEESDDKSTQQTTDTAYGVLKKIGLDDTSDVSKVIERVSAKLFSQDSISIECCVRIAQISAKLGATISNVFRFATQDCNLRSIDSMILYDSDGTLEDFVPIQDRPTHLLHKNYTQSFTSCTTEEWHRWVMSGRSGLRLFVPIVEKHQEIYGRDRIQEEVKQRGLQGTVSYPYVTNYFVIHDWDFNDSYWRHWESMSNDDDHVWSRIVERILSMPESFWSEATNARALHIATNRSKSAITREPLLPAWILKLRDLRCLPDTRGFYHKPGDLLRRTPETEALIDVEPFVSALFDREATRPLLDLLGVRSIPTGPDRLLDCLRALSKAENPPAHEVEKWYRRLDQLIDDCSTTDLQNIRQAFLSENLILTVGGSWATSRTVFLVSDEDGAPGAEIIRPSVAYLSLWRKIDVAERPTAELVIKWLQGLPSGESLSPDDSRRVTAMLRRHPIRVWEECGHWLNLSGEWAPVVDLKYALTMQSLIAWSHLYEWVKQKTANLRFLSSETSKAPPFTVLLPLASVIKDCLHRDLTAKGQSKRKPWLVTLGEELCRIELEDGGETARIRELANELANTEWLDTPGLEIIPYIDGTPAGTPRRADVIWSSRILYVDRVTKAKLARVVPEEIGKHFNHSEIKDALVYSFERPQEDILAYLEENYKLVPRQALTQPEDKPGEDSVEIEPANVTPGEEAPHAGTGLSKPEEQEEPIEPEIAPESHTIDEHEKPEDVGDDGRKKTHRPEKPQTPGILERFVHVQGFRQESADRYCHGDGCQLAKTTNGSPFPWELRNKIGEIVRYFWPKDHCLSDAPLQIPAEVWSLCELHPEKYSLILSDHDGTPVELSGRKLTEMRKHGNLTIYPAMYRIVQKCN